MSSISSEYKDEIVLGDANEVLGRLPQHHYNMCVTSPPYWKCRTYSNDRREVGREEHPHDYIERMTKIFAKVRECLKPEGSLWVNVDDTYENGPLMIPERLAVQMIKDGWYLKNKVIWYKVDAMPESVPRRFARKYEMFYWFTVQEKRYYFNPEATKIPVSVATVERFKYGFNSAKSATISRMRSLTGDLSHKAGEYLERGVNCGDVWASPTNKDRVAHFAPYPEDLIVRPIAACSPEGGHILDPFMGSGTTALAARKMLRHFTGIELNIASVHEAKERIKEWTASPSLFEEVARESEEGEQLSLLGDDDGDSD